MKRRTIPGSGLQVSVLGLGGVTFGHGLDANGTDRIIRTAHDLGINFIDTAPIYGEPFGDSEDFIGRAIRGIRDDFVVGTKVGFPAEYSDEEGCFLPDVQGLLTPGEIERSLDRSLKRLRTDHVDILYLHWPDSSTPLDDTWAALARLQQSGKVLSFGLSWHSAEQMRITAELCESRGWMAPSVINDSYNLLDRSIEEAVSRECERLGVAIAPAFPLAGGLLTGKYGAENMPSGSRLSEFEQFRPWTDNVYLDAVAPYSAYAQDHGHTVAELALTWLLHRPMVCSVISGTTSPAQLNANAKAMEWSLSADELAEIDRLPYGQLPRLF
jgi:aryl-alcohol dehydrogenase-like predicted oxidoreductase